MQDFKTIECGSSVPTIIEHTNMVSNQGIPAFTMNQEMINQMGGPDGLGCLSPNYEG